MKLNLFFYLTANRLRSAKLKWINYMKDLRTWQRNAEESWTRHLNCISCKAKSMIWNTGSLRKKLWPDQKTLDKISLKWRYIFSSKFVSCYIDFE